MNEVYGRVEVALVVEDEAECTDKKQAEDIHAAALVEQVVVEANDGNNDGLVVDEDVAPNAVDVVAIGDDDIPSCGDVGSPAEQILE